MREALKFATETYDRDMQTQNSKLNAMFFKRMTNLKLKSKKKQLVRTGC